MSQIINVSVSNKIATTTFGEVVSFNSVYELNFTFDAEWAEFTQRVAVVTWGDKCAVTAFEGTSCKMPMIFSPNCENVFLGVYSIKGEERIASSFVRLKCKAGAYALPSEKPSQTLYDEVIALMNERLSKTKLDNALVVFGKSFDGGEAVEVEISDLGLAPVALSGSYNDLTDKPTVPAVSVSSVNGKTGAVEITAEDLSLSAVATSGSYQDLTDKPTVPAVSVSSVNGKTGAVEITAEEFGLSSVAFSGSYNDLVDKPTVTGGNGENGKDGLSIFFCNSAVEDTMLDVSVLTAFHLSSVNIPEGRSLQIGDFIVVGTAERYLFQIKALNGQTFQASYLMTLSQASEGGAGNAGAGDILNSVYPVGAIYMSVQNTSPASFLGGTWAQITDKYLVGVGTELFTQAEAIGGSATAQLTTANLPAHTHDIKCRSIKGAGGDVFMAMIDATNYLGEFTRVNRVTGGTGLNGEAFSILPPSLAVYIWKRTA